ncbi:MAG TPA: hypothetical protein VJW51_00175 [Candidatus Acidoferrales bacterium]|nr:hypothetical protein [Candidatus Acidoferrales bacterium]
MEELTKDAGESAEILNSPSAPFIATFELPSKPLAEFSSARCAGREPL